MPANRSSGPTVRGERQIGLVGEVVEDPSDVFERFALDQACQQQVALFPHRKLVVEVHVVGPRQQPAGLELDQRGGDQQELGGHVEIE